MLDQTRPPDPVEVDRSKFKVSQMLKMVGAEIETVGSSGWDGPRMETALAFTKAQLWQLERVHFAFKVPGIKETEFEMRIEAVGPKNTVNFEKESH